MYTFYKSSNNPAALTGTVGGSIGSQPISGYLGELFYHVSGPPSGVASFYQYRKVFVRNEFLVQSSDTKLWLDALDHPEQIAISKEANLSDTSTSPTGQPAGVTGWYTPTNYIEGLDLGTLGVSASTGVWIRQTLTGIIEEDPFASFRIVVGGLVGS